ncbi:MAG: hypothetical protein EU530_02925 [Promethearchaeota archaeon]|nr:MAG: hypothetical protein EU530_02925 [Candidatus Lokiarchaeota archaeon]
MDKNKKYFWLIIGNLVSIIAVIVVNALAVILPLNGKDTGELSDNIPNLFVPAGITFSVWSVIYLWFIFFAGFNIYTLIKKKDEDIEAINRVGIWFILSSVGNFVWIFLWHWELVNVSLFFMLLILVSLIMVYIRLGIGKRDVSWTEGLLVHLTISFYMGWITVATIANIVASLVTQNLVPFLTSFGISEATWTIIVIGAAAVISILNVFTRKDIGYNLVIIWALSGIIIKRASVLPVETGIIISTGIAIGAILLSLIIKWSYYYFKK